jgi:uncharacterized membrane protein YsdA (DUF1294 family)
MSLACAAAYWKDKSAAKKGQWRIRESTLLILGLLGGWPGAVLAQQMLRHKTRKVAFQVIFWMTVILNVGALIIAFSPWMRIVKT